LVSAFLIQKFRRENMARIYISGPITGTKGYLKHFAAAEHKLKDLGHEVINPARNGYVMPASSTHEEYMKVCLAQLSCCNAILMLKGWKESKGAREEFCYAVDHTMPIIFEED